MATVAAGSRSLTLAVSPACPLAGFAALSTLVACTARWRLSAASCSTMIGCNCALAASASRCVFYPKIATKGLLARSAAACAVAASAVFAASIRLRAATVC